MGHKAKKTQNTGPRARLPGERSIFRVMDANANRCREGLRVAEDYARFILDSERLAKSFKDLRHQVTDAVKSIGSEELIIGARDTEDDIGTRINTSQETGRASEEDVLKSAVKRAEEALRVLEEFSKLVSPEAAPRFQTIRYTVYTMEQELFAALPPHKSP